MTHVVKTADGGTFEPVFGEKAKVLNEHTRHEIDEWIGRFPTGRQRSAVLAVKVYEVATFYSMFETHPCGRHHVSICTNISCMLNGAEDLVKHCEKKLGIKLGESTSDGRIFLKQEEECLAACTGAPMMMVDHVFHEYLTPEKVDKVLDELK